MGYTLNDGSVFFIWAGGDSVLHALGGTDDSTTTLRNTIPKGLATILI